MKTFKQFNLCESILGNYEYKLPESPKEKMFDFYMLAGFPETDDEIVDFIVEYVKTKAYPALKDHLLGVVLEAMCDEMGHFVGTSELSYNSEIKSQILNDLNSIYADERPRLDDVSDVMKKYEGQLFEFVSVIKDCFSIEAEWGYDVGGPKWAKIATGWLKLYETPNDNIPALQTWIDNIYHLQHNTGSVFTKIKDYYIPSEGGEYVGGYQWIRIALNKKRDAKDLHELYPDISRSLRRLADVVLKKIRDKYSYEDK